MQTNKKPHHQPLQIGLCGVGTRQLHQLPENAAILGAGKLTFKRQSSLFDVFQDAIQLI
jgi:hypothetical protein